VSDVARAAAIATERGLATRTGDDSLLVAIEERETPPLVSALVTAGIDVFHVQRKVQSLEEMFLEATGGETVG
jgi:hypothetical protein